MVCVALDTEEPKNLGINIFSHSEMYMKISIFSEYVQCAFSASRALLAPNFTSNWAGVMKRKTRVVLTFHIIESCHHIKDRIYSWRHRYRTNAKNQIFCYIHKKITKKKVAMFQLMMQQWVRSSGWPLSLTMGLKNKIFNFHFHTRPLIWCRSVRKYLCRNTALIQALNFQTLEFLSSHPLKQSDWTQQQCGKMRLETKLRSFNGVKVAKKTLSSIYSAGRKYESEK